MHKTGFQKIGRCYLDYDGRSSTKNINTFLSHNGKIIGVLAEEEMKQLPSYIKEKRVVTKRLKNACDKYRKRLPETCIDAENIHHNAMIKTENEKTIDLHEKYHITYDLDGKRQIEGKKKKTSHIVAGSLARGLVEYGVPTWAQYESNKGLMEYNTQLGYGLKTRNYLLENPGTFIYGIGGFQSFGYSGLYPMSGFGGSFAASPFLSTYPQIGSFQYNYITAR